MQLTEENLEALFNKEFDLLKRVKALGFISIIEREYGADLAALKKDAIAYYDSHQEDESVVLDAPVIEKRKDRSKLFIFLIVILFAVKPDLSIEEAVSEANDTESNSHSESTAVKLKEENGAEGSSYQSHTNL